MWSFGGAVSAEVSPGGGVVTTPGGGAVSVHCATILLTGAPDESVPLPEALNTGPSISTELGFVFPQLRSTVYSWFPNRSGGLNVIHIHPSEVAWNTVLSAPDSSTVWL